MFVLKVVLWLAVAAAIYLSRTGRATFAPVLIVIAAALFVADIKMSGRRAKRATESNGIVLGRMETYALWFALALAVLWVGYGFLHAVH